MNSDKWRIITLPTKTVEDLIASHLYAMRGMSNREIIDLSLPEYFKDSIQIKIKLKEDKLVDQSSIKE